MPPLKKARTCRITDFVAAPKREKGSPKSVDLSSSTGWSSVISSSCVVRSNNSGRPAQPVRPDRQADTKTGRRVSDPIRDCFDTHKKNTARPGRQLHEEYSCTLEHKIDNNGCATTLVIPSEKAALYVVNPRENKRGNIPQNA